MDLWSSTVSCQVAAERELPKFESTQPKCKNTMITHYDVAGTSFHPSRCHSPLCDWGDVAVGGGEALREGDGGGVGRGAAALAEVDGRARAGRGQA